MTVDFEFAYLHSQYEKTRPIRTDGDRR